MQHLSTSTHELTSAPFATEVQQKIAVLPVHAPKCHWGKRWSWTVRARGCLCALMDEDTSALIQALCVRAGMIMEDESVGAITFKAGEGTDAEAKLLRLTHAAKVMSQLLDAASALSSFR